MVSWNKKVTRSTWRLQGNEEGTYGLQVNEKLYGLMQAPRQWYKDFDSFMLHGYKRTFADHWMFILNILVMMFLLFSYCMLMKCLLLEKFFQKLINYKKKLSKSFDKKCRFNITYLGNEIFSWQKIRKLWLSQESYGIMWITKKFNMKNSHM